MVGVQARNAATRFSNSINYSIVLLYTLFVLFPVFWIGLLSLKDEIQAFANPPLFIFEPTFTNYYDLFFEENFGKFLLNSIIVAVSSAVFCLRQATQ